MTQANPKCLIIAEAGNNHEGHLDTALELIERAKEAGADLVKFQAGMAEGFARNPTDATEVAKYRRYELGRTGYDRLVAHGIAVGIPVFFSVWSPEFEDYFKLPWRKIAARQCTRENVARHDSPATFVSIPHTLPLKHVAALGLNKSVPMHVVAQYPASSAMQARMRDVRLTLRLNVGDVGYSDHTVGIYWPVRMATHPQHRARAVEKHFTLAHDFGPLRDHTLSATPKEMKEMVERIKI